MSKRYSKKSFRTVTITLGVIILAGVLLYACGESEKAAEEGAPPTEKQLEAIKLAVVGPHSGDLASYGIPTIKAAELVVEHRNSMNGVNGRKIELIVEDDVCKPEVAANTATKVVGEKVHAVLGHICSGATKAALGIYKDSSMVAMSPSATNPALTQSGDHPNFYRTIASDDAQAKLEVDFAINTLKLKKIAVLHDKGDYGKGLAEFVKGFVDTSNNPMAVEAIAAHKKKYGKDPGAFFLNAYSAALALLNVIEKTGSTDYAEIKKALRTEFVATPLGIIRFDERGDAIGVGFSMYQVQDIRPLVLGAA